MTHRFLDIERNIARCRIVLSVVGIMAVYLDPTPPAFSTRTPVAHGPFSIDPSAFAVMVSHLAYSLTLYIALAYPLASPRRLQAIATWGDVLFGPAIALFTEGTTSPFYAFFVFAVLAVGFRGGFRHTMLVTAVSVSLYLSLILVSAPHNASFYIMRPAYLAIAGYLVGYLGQQRLALEARIRELETTEQRQAIARSLHDGYCQALAGVNLRLETCRQLLDRGQVGDAFGELTELQAGVNREHDELRTYIRSLAAQEARPTPNGGSTEQATRFTVKAQFSGGLPLVEHALHIMLEGARNVGRHARARAARIEAASEDDKIVISIDDDGVGFPPDASLPWSIASRVAEVGGRIDVGRADATGARLLVELPQ
jgi:signal transduction histidine kinase